MVWVGALAAFTVLSVQIFDASLMAETSKDEILNSIMSSASDGLIKPAGAPADLSPTQVVVGDSGKGSAENIGAGLRSIDDYIL